MYGISYSFCIFAQEAVKKKRMRFNFTFDASQPSGSKSVFKERGKNQARLEM